MKEVMVIEMKNLFYRTNRFNPHLHLTLFHFHEKCEKCVKSACIWSYSGPHFPAFGLNTDQKNSEYGHFSGSAIYIYFLQKSLKATS